MGKLMAVFLNGIAQLEYDRDRPLPARQAAYIEQMEAKMDAGILIDGETVAHPDLAQRTRFVAARLLQALNSGDEAMTAALCSYLAVRHPALKQLRIEDSDAGVTMELVYDREYRRQVAVDISGLQ